MRTFRKCAEGLKYVDMPGDEDKSQKQSRLHSILTGQFISAYEIILSNMNTYFIDSNNKKFMLLVLIL